MSSSAFSPYGWLLDIHHIPHLTPHVREVIPDAQGNYDIGSSEYLSSLGTITAVGGVLGGLLLIGIVICILVRWFCPSRVPRTPSRHYILMALLLLTLTSTMLCLGMLYKQALSLTDDANTLVDTYHTTVNNLANTQSYYSQDEMSKLAAEVQGTPVQQAEQQLEKDLFNTILDVELLSATLPALNVASYTSDIRDFAHILEIIAFSVFSLATITIAALPFTSKRWVRWVFFFLAVFFCVASAVSCGGVLAGLTLTADICCSPSSQIERYVHDDQEKKYVTYYLECASPGLPQSWAKDFENAGIALSAARSDSQTIFNYLFAQGLSTDIIVDVLLNISAINRTLTSGAQSLDCSGVHKEYNKIVEGVCDNTSPYMLALVCTLLLMSILLFSSMIAVLIHTPPRPRRAVTEKTPLLSVNDEEPIPDARCKICLSKPISITLRPCGHTVCGECAPKFQQCPYCRGAIRERLPLFV